MVMTVIDRQFLPLHLQSQVESLL